MHMCWTLFSFELFVVNDINISERRLTVCFCVLSREESTHFTVFLECSLKIFWGHDQQEPQECAGGVCRLSLFVHGLWRPAEPTGEQNANV